MVLPTECPRSERLLEGICSKKVRAVVLPTECLRYSQGLGGHGALDRVDAQGLTRVFNVGKSHIAVLCHVMPQSLFHIV